MNFNEYQEMAKKTANNEQEKKYRLANYAMGLSGEAGEVTDYLKKVVFHEHELEVEKLKDELGDVLWYIANLADNLELDLEDIASDNITKLKKRYPEGFSSSRSIDRE